MTTYSEEEKYYPNAEPGVCPICNSNNIEYTSKDYEADYEFDSLICLDCKTEFYEEYEIKYRGTYQTIVTEHP
jgi:hypothetical protein